MPRAAWRWIGVTGALIVLLVCLLWGGWFHVAPVALQAVTTQAILAIAALYFLYLLFGAGLTRIERRRVLALAVLFLASALFWAGYEQAGSSLNLFAERYTDRHWAGMVVPATLFQ